MAVLTIFGFYRFFDADFTYFVSQLQGAIVHCAPAIVCLVSLVACCNAFAALFLIWYHWDLRTLVLWFVSFALSGLMHVSTFLLTFPGTERNEAIRSTMKSIIEAHEQMRVAVQDIVPCAQLPMDEETAARERHRRQLLREKRTLRMRHIRRYINNIHPTLQARSFDQMKVAFLGDGLVHHGHCLFDAELFNDRGDGDPGWPFLEEEEKQAFLDSYGLSVEDVLMHAGNDRLIQLCDRWGTLNFDDDMELIVIDNHWPPVMRAQALLQQNNHTDAERHEVDKLDALLASLERAAKRGNRNYNNSDEKRKKEKKKAERRKQLQNRVGRVYEGDPWAFLTESSSRKDKGSIGKAVKAAGSLLNGRSSGSWR